MYSPSLRLLVSAWAVAQITTFPVAAAHFANSYVSFDMPDGWTCTLEETEFVCRPPRPPDGRYSMLVILTAKEVGKTDSPQLYMRHLQGIGRRAGVVVAVPPKNTLIGQALWLDASFWNSEVQNYRTRYLVRTEGDIGVMVTFSSHSSASEEADRISDLIARSVMVNSSFARPELRQ